MRLQVSSLPVCTPFNQLQSPSQFVSTPVLRHPKKIFREQAGDSAEGSLNTKSISRVQWIHCGKKKKKWMKRLVANRCSRPQHVIWKRHFKTKQKPRKMNTPSHEIPLAAVHTYSQKRHAFPHASFFRWMPLETRNRECMPTEIGGVAWRVRVRTDYFLNDYVSEPCAPSISLSAASHDPTIRSFLVWTDCLFVCLIGFLFVWLRN